MTNRILSKLKIGIKHILGRCVYIYTYSTNKLKKIWKSLTHKTSSNTHRTDLITLATTRWKGLITVIFVFLCVYYGLGLLIDAKIDNKLNLETKTTSLSEQHTLNSLIYTLKTQIDDNTWAPGLPLIFPAAVSDNLSNFQLGAKETIKYFVDHLAHLYKNKNLIQAGKLLGYPPNIWLFSQTQNEKFAPGSVKQYRKALAFIKQAAENKNEPLLFSKNELLYILKATRNLINNDINKLANHIQEHSSDLADLRADDIFYRTSGTIYVLHYFLNAITKDYKSEILKTEQYENMTTILKLLAQAIDINPIFIKNADIQKTFAANHLLYQTYYLSQVQNKLSEIYYTIMLTQQEAPQ